MPSVASNASLVVTDFMLSRKFTSSSRSADTSDRTSATCPETIDQRSDRTATVCSRTIVRFSRFASDVIHPPGSSLGLRFTTAMLSSQERHSVIPLHLFPPRLLR